MDQVELGSIEQQKAELERIRSDCNIFNTYDHKIREQMEENLRIFLIRKHNKGNRYNTKCDYCQTHLFYLNIYSEQYRRLLNDAFNWRSNKKDGLLIYDINDDITIIQKKLCCINCNWKNQNALNDKKIDELQERMKRLKIAKPLKKRITAVYKCPMWNCDYESSSKNLTFLHLAEHDQYDLTQAVEK